MNTAAEGPSTPKATAKKAVKTVLVVDDSRTFRHAIVQRLHSAFPDAHLVDLPDGAAALRFLAELEAANKPAPALIITDLEMPELDGWQLLERLRQDYEAQHRPHGVPVIVCSSTNGVKKGWFSRQSIHGGKCPYTPLVTVAKDNCLETTEYLAKGEKGLLDWARFFLNCSGPGAAPRETEKRVAQV